MQEYMRLKFCRDRIDRDGVKSRIRTGVSGPARPNPISFPGRFTTHVRVARLPFSQSQILARGFASVTIRA